MIARYNVITSWLAPLETHFVEQAVFGTIDPHSIACQLDTFCQEELGAPIADCLFYESSIGAVCGVCLRDGRCIVVKVHQPAHSLDFLQAVVRVQRYLLDSGYPCPKPLLDPRPLANGIATTEEFLDEGEYHQADDPAIRRSMAEMFAWLIQLTRMDEIARQALEIRLRGAGQLVLGHVDWGVKHFRYVGEKVRVIYDWDSLALEKEPILVGHASVYFTYTEFFGEARLPTAEESHAFVVEYETARGKPFTYEEHQTLKAAKIYSLAYSARCEHALYPDETTYPEGSCRSLLSQYRI